MLRVGRQNKELFFAGEATRPSLVLLSEPCVWPEPLALGHVVSETPQVRLAVLNRDFL